MEYLKYNSPNPIYYENDRYEEPSSTTPDLDVHNILQHVKKTTLAYCICGGPYDPNIFMIQCDRCDNWFHGNCVDVREYQALDIDKYHCPRCQDIFGPSIGM